MKQTARKAGYVSAAERRKLPHAGPGDNYPLKPGLIKSAWDLAGRTKKGNPDAIRRKVIAYAKSHGLLGRLPASAVAWGKAHGVLAGGDVKKAKQSRIAELLALAWHHESMEGDTAEKHRLVEWASQNGLMSSLPTDAHGFMHEAGVEHDHGDGKLKHGHPVQKAINPVSKWTHIEKAWTPEGSSDTIIEGWVSTEDPDRDKDVVPPEAFNGSLDGYMARKGPLSSNHDTRGYPIGHMQRVALVRDGQVFKSASHPDDPADFEHFPGSGTGVYGRGVITDASAGNAVKKGNIGGFSWIGNLKKYEPLPGGGRRFLEVDPLLENTVAAYPVNGNAVLLAAKAYGLDVEASAAQDAAAATNHQGEYNDMGKLEDILLEAAAALDEEETETADAVTKAELGDLFKEFEQRMAGIIEEKVQKALPVEREEGAGRSGTVQGAKTAQDPRDNDPASYIISKAKSSENGLTDEADRDLAWGITFAMMSDGMRD